MTINLKSKAPKRDKLNDLAKAKELNKGAMTVHQGGYIDGVKVRGITSIDAKSTSGSVSHGFQTHNL